MDPKVTHQNWLNAVLANNMDDAKEYAEYLMDWLENGGSSPFRTNNEADEFYTWYNENMP